MSWFYSMFAVITAAAAILLWRTLPPRRTADAPGHRALIVAILFAALCAALLTPAAVLVIDKIRTNTAHMLSDVSALGLSAALLIWVTQLSRGKVRALDDRPAGRRAGYVICGFYSAAAIALIVLFFASPTQQRDVGFLHDFANNPLIQAFWIVFAISFAVGLAAAGALFMLSARNEHGLRLAGTGGIVLGCILGVGYCVWKIVLVTRFAAETPQWAQRVSTLFIVSFVGLIAVGVVVPPFVGLVRATRSSATRVRQLAPLHDFLMRQYPELQYRRRADWRPTNRSTDMLVEISDALRRLQRESPELAAAHCIDHESVSASTTSTAPVAYEMAAATLFSSVTPAGR